MKIVLEQRDQWNELFRPFSQVLHHSFAWTEERQLDKHFAIGSFAFIQKCLRAGAAAYCDKEFLTWSNYAPHFKEELLNSDYIILPACEIPRLKFQFLGQFGKECQIFVRPNEATKVFDGMLLDIEKFQYFGSLYESTLVVIARPQKILGEWRFVVEKSGEILGYSSYRYQGEFVRVASCPPAMINYVKSLIEMAKWTDPVITMDIAQLPDMSFKLIECNALSTSGLYACEPEKIVEYIKNIS